MHEADNREEDVWLWRGLLNGDHDSLSKLFNKYYRPLLTYGLKLVQGEELVKDSIQELFFWIWKKRTNLTEVEYVRAYLYSSLRRMVFRQREIQETRNRRDVDYSEESFQKEINQEEYIIQREIKQEQRELIKEALERLSDHQKEVIFLKFYSGLSSSEIAEVMEVSKQSVYTYMYRAIKALNEFL